MATTKQKDAITSILNSTAFASPIHNDIAEFQGKTDFNLFNIIETMSSEEPDYQDLIDEFGVFGHIEQTYFNLIHWTDQHFIIKNHRPLLMSHSSMANDLSNKLNDLNVPIDTIDGGVPYNTWFEDMLGSIYGTLDATHSAILNTCSGIEDAHPTEYLNYINAIKSVNTINHNIQEILPFIGNTFVIANDYTELFTNNMAFDVIHSASNNKTYTVESSSWDGINTTIIVDDVIPDGRTMLGDIRVKSYPILEIINNTVTINDDYTAHFTPTTLFVIKNYNNFTPVNYKVQFSTYDQINNLTTITYNNAYFPVLDYNNMEDSYSYHLDDNTNQLFYGEYPTISIDVNINSYWVKYVSVDNVGNVFRGESNLANVTIINSSSEPATSPNLYWYDTINNALNQWNEYLLIWEPRSLYLLNLNADNIVNQPIAPTLPAPYSYWCDINTNNIYQWNNDLLTWTLQPLTILLSIHSDTAPLSPILQSYWFNTITKELKLWDGIGWVAQSLTLWTFVDIVDIQSVPPSFPVSGSYWYNTQELKQYNGTSWESLPTQLCTYTEAPILLGEIYINWPKHSNVHTPPIHHQDIINNYNIIKTHKFNEIIITGDYTTQFISNSFFYIINSSDNNGKYTVINSRFDAGSTIITINERISDIYDLGEIQSPPSQSTIHTAVFSALTALESVAGTEILQLENLSNEIQSQILREQWWWGDITNDLSFSTYQTILSFTIPAGLSLSLHNYKSMPLLNQMINRIGSTSIVDAINETP